MNKEEKIEISLNEEDVQNIINCYEKDIEYIKQLEQENKQLKHTIDELEKWLEEKLKEKQFIIDDVDIAFEVDYERINEAKNYKVAYNSILNKLQELKGSDNDE